MKILKPKAKLMPLLISVCLVISLAGCQHQEVPEVSDTKQAEPEFNSTKQELNSSDTTWDIAPLSSNRSVWSDNATHIVEFLNHAQDFEGNYLNPIISSYVYLDIPLNHGFEINDIQHFEVDVRDYDNSYPYYLDVEQILKLLQDLNQTQNAQIELEDSRFPSYAYQYLGLDSNSKHRYNFYFGNCDQAPLMWYYCYFFDISFDNQLSFDDIIFIVNSFWKEEKNGLYKECIVDLNSKSVYNTASYRKKDVSATVLPESYIKLDLPRYLDFNNLDFKLSNSSVDVFNQGLDLQTYNVGKNFYPNAVKKFSNYNYTDYYGIVKLDSQLYFNVHFKISTEDYCEPNLGLTEYVDN